VRRRYLGDADVHDATGGGDDLRPVGRPAGQLLGIAVEEPEVRGEPGEVDGESSGDVERAVDRIDCLAMGVATPIGQLTTWTAALSW
jgi:hypothetical protein